MKPQWQKKPERGSLWLTRFIIWLSVKTDRRVGRLLLYPISAYFCLISTESRTASRNYLTTILRQRASLAQIYWHYLTYARVMLDRVFFLTGQMDGFDIAMDGHEVVDELLASGRGFIFLGAHQGSFDVLRVLGASRPEINVKVMMYPDNSTRITSLLNRLNPALSEEIILLGRPNAMLHAKQHVEKGGIIGLLGDRIAKGDKLVRSSFLGRPANFPAGPLLLARVLKVPVVLFYGLYLGGARYEVHFEMFADRIVTTADRRHDDLQHLIDLYATRLEHFCQREPYNWFNFYDFWENSDATP